MRKDIYMFTECSSPTVRIYGWDKDCITYGYSQDMSKEIDLKKADELGIECAKRPTGGGLALHSKDDLAYCVVSPSEYMPKGIKGAYLYISTILLDALKELGVDAEIIGHRSKIKDTHADLCFSSSLDHEITINGRKLVGSAQKRSREKVIQQGAISVSDIPENMYSVLLKKDALAGLRENSVRLSQIFNDQRLFDKLKDSRRMRN